VEIGVRPEDVIVDPDGVDVGVGRGYFTGDHGIARVELAPGAWAEMRTEDRPPDSGSRVRVRLRRLHLFDRATGSVVGRIEDGSGK
jgi:hypothetical protein